MNKKKRLAQKVSRFSLQGYEKVIYFRWCQSPRRVTLL